MAQPLLLRDLAIDLLNDAKNARDANSKLYLLEQVKEIAFHRDRSTLPGIINDFHSFVVEKNSSVRRFLLKFASEAMYIEPESASPLLLSFVDYLLVDLNESIIRSAIITFNKHYEFLVKMIANAHRRNVQAEEHWKLLLSISTKIQSFAASSRADQVKLACLRFCESFTLFGLPKSPAINDPRLARSAAGRRAIAAASAAAAAGDASADTAEGGVRNDRGGLEKVNFEKLFPDTSTTAHPFINRQEIQKDAEGMLSKLVLWASKGGPQGYPFSATIMSYVGEIISQIATARPKYSPNVAKAVVFMIQGKGNLSREMTGRERERFAKAAHGFYRTASVYSSKDPEGLWPKLRAAIAVLEEMGLADADGADDVVERASVGDKRSAAQQEQQQQLKRKKGVDLAGITAGEGEGGGREEEEEDGEEGEDSETTARRQAAIKALNSSASAIAATAATAALQKQQQQQQLLRDVNNNASASESQASALPAPLLSTSSVTTVPSVETTTTTISTTDPSSAKDESDVRGIDGEASSLLRGSSSKGVPLPALDSIKLGDATEMSADLMLTLPPISLSPSLSSSYSHSYSDPSFIATTTSPHPGDAAAVAASGVAAVESRENIGNNNNNGNNYNNDNGGSQQLFIGIESSASPAVTRMLAGCGRTAAVGDIFRRPIVAPAQRITPATAATTGGGGGGTGYEDLCALTLQMFFNSYYDLSRINAKAIRAYSLLAVRTALALSLHELDSFDAKFGRSVRNIDAVCAVDVQIFSTLSSDPLAKQLAVDTPAVVKVHRYHWLLACFLLSKPPPLLFSASISSLSASLDASTSKNIRSRASAVAEQDAHIIESKINILVALCNALAQSWQDIHDSATIPSEEEERDNSGGGGSSDKLVARRKGEDLLFKYHSALCYASLSRVLYLPHVRRATNNNNNNNSANAARMFVRSLLRLPAPCIHLLNLVMLTGSKPSGAGSGLDHLTTTAAATTSAVVGSTGGALLSGVSISSASATATSGGTGTGTIGTGVGGMRRLAMELLGEAVFSPDEEGGRLALHKLLQCAVAEDIEVRSRVVAYIISHILQASDWSFEAVCTFALHAAAHLVGEPAMRSWCSLQYRHKQQQEEEEEEEQQQQQSGLFKQRQQESRLEEEAKVTDDGTPAENGERERQVKGEDSAVLCGVKIEANQNEDEDGAMDIVTPTETAALATVATTTTATTAAAAEVGATISADAVVDADAEVAMELDAISMTPSLYKAFSSYDAGVSFGARFPARPEISSISSKDSDNNSANNLKAMDVYARRMLHLLGQVCLSEHTMLSSYPDIYCALRWQQEQEEDQKLHLKKEIEKEGVEKEERKAGREPKWDFAALLHGELRNIIPIVTQLESPERIFDLMTRFLSFPPPLSTKTTTTTTTTTTVTTTSTEAAAVADSRRCFPLIQQLVALLNPDLAVPASTDLVRIVRNFVLRAYPPSPSPSPSPAASAPAIAVDSTATTTAAAAAAGMADITTVDSVAAAASNSTHGTSSLTLMEGAAAGAAGREREQEEVEQQREGMMLSGIEDGEGFLLMLPLLSGVSREELEQHLHRVIRMLKDDMLQLQTVFLRITKARPPPFKKSALLVYLHRLDHEACGLKEKTVLEAIALCLKPAMEFSADHIKDALRTLASGNPSAAPGGTTNTSTTAATTESSSAAIPRALMRTAILASLSNGDVKRFVLSDIIPTLIKRQVWLTAPRVWEGVIVGARKLAVTGYRNSEMTLRALLGVPGVQLRSLLKEDAGGGSSKSGTAVEGGKKEASQMKLALVKLLQSLSAQEREEVLSGQWVGLVQQQLQQQQPTAAPAGTKQAGGGEMDDIKKKIVATLLKP